MLVLDQGMANVAQDVLDQSDDVIRFHALLWAEPGLTKHLDLRICQLGAGLPFPPAELPQGL